MVNDIEGISDMDIINVSRKYQLRPGYTLVCLTFLLFDRGFSLAEVRLLLRKRKARNTSELSYYKTLIKYQLLWKKAQESIKQSKASAKEQVKKSRKKSW